MTYRIHCDFETRSIVDLRTRGSAVYAQHPSTIPTMLSVVTPSMEGVIDFIGRDNGLKAYSYPQVGLDNPLLNSYKPSMHPILQEAMDDDAIFVAHNASFERDIWWYICHLRWGWPMPKRWSCTAARSAYWGLRRSLEGSGSDLELPIQKKSEEGTTFIKEFCCPRKFKGPKKNGIITQHWKEPHEDPVGWQKGLEYCLDDAKVEKLIDDILPDLPPFEQAIWDMDFEMNTRGIPIDLESVYRAAQFSEHYNDVANIEFERATGYYPTQRDRVLEYLNSRAEIDGNLDNLRSKTLSRLNMADFPQELKRTIQTRVDASRASIKKLDGMKNAVFNDEYARGCFVYYGAHTGRWSAKRLQPHNYIRGNKTSAKQTFTFLESEVWKEGSQNGMPAWLADAELCFPSPLRSLSQSMRGFIKAPDGSEILSGDYSQVEARVLAWLANCETLLTSYAAGEDVYVRFAADHMYRRRYTDYFGPDGNVLSLYSDERQRAKSAVLGCGFGLGGAGFQRYCDNVDIILTEEEADKVVKAYRRAYPEIADWNWGLWRKINNCAIEAIQNEGQTVTLWGTEVTFHIHRVDSERWWLIVTLPSRRHIAYYRPKVDSVDRFGRPVMSFRTEWHGKTFRTDTWGGELTENIVQAVARDICAYAAVILNGMGFKVFMLVHDEIVTLVPKGSNSLTPSVMRDVMLNLPPAYGGLPLDAEVKRMIRYSK